MTRPLPKRIVLPKWANRGQQVPALSYWRDWLQNESIDPRKRILEALRSPYIPPDILHHFACDCASYALESVAQQTRYLPPVLLEALETKGLWVEGQVPTKALAEARDNLTHAHLEGPYAALAQRVLAAIHQEPQIAARYASACRCPQEQRWQCHQLHRRLTGLQKVLQRLLRLLRLHAQDPKLPYWKASLEETLFR